MPEIKFPSEKSTPFDRSQWKSWTNDQQRSDLLKFNLEIPSQLKLFQANERLPTPREPFVDLAYFRDDLENPNIEVLIQATVIQDEVALRHYLRNWSTLLGEEIVDHQVTPSDSDHPDFLLTRSFRDGETRVGRRTSYKVWMGYGAFVVILSVSCEANKYPEYDQMLDAIVAGFGPKQPPEHPYAEQLKLLSKRYPFDFATYLPLSWKETHHHNDTLDEMRTCLHRKYRGKQIGGITVYCASRSRHKNSREFVGAALSTWDSLGVDMEQIDIRAGLNLGKLATRRGVTPVEFVENGNSTQYTLQFHWASLKDCRFYVELMGVSKEGDFESWAINQRALSIFISEFKHLPLD